MRDLFDDLEAELRRRAAIARGEDPDQTAPRDARRVGPDDAADDEDDRRSDDDAGDAFPEDQAHPSGGGPTRRDPPRPIRRSRRRDRGRRIGTWLVIGIVIAVVVLLSFGLDLFTDALWFKSVGFDGVFWTRVAAQALLFAGTLLVALLLLGGNLWLAGRLAAGGPDEPTRGATAVRSWIDRLGEAATTAAGDRPGAWGRQETPTVVFETGDLPDLTPVAGAVLGGLAVLISLGIAGGVAAAWQVVLLWVHQVPFSPDLATPVTDPIFGKDISFFLFQLPFLKLVQGLASGLLVASLVLTLSRYLVVMASGRAIFHRPVRLHLAVLGGLFLLVVAAGYQLDKYDLAYSTRGVASGVSFTDQHAQFFAFDLLTILSALTGVVLVATAFARRLLPLALTVGVWLVASIVVGRLYPDAIQRFSVAPNEFAQESPYIGNNIAMTRIAFGLDKWEDRSFRGDAVLTQDMITSEADTFQNARLWDYRPLGATLDQLQTVRRYYDFTDVDTDRYVINDDQRQVMLAGRELALEQNEKVTGWVNQRVIYTHGIGLAMVPVNEVTNDGQPRLIIQNLPPVSSDGAPPVTEPRIYFGERPSSYVVVGAKQPEFDFPTGETDVAGGAGTETRWTGTTGIRLDGLNRLLFALRFRDLDLLISDQVSSDSQLLFHRSLADRLTRIAPFLRYDKDPYLVVDGNGRLQYVQDAYTVSDAFPHAQPFDPATFDSTGLGGGSFNYIRNSVKITMDAYDGTMHFYVSDANDPLIRAYQATFPNLFQSMSELPTALRAHLRVPEELFNVQTAMYGRYHVTDNAQFFRNDDLWTVPQGQTSEQTLPSEAYYVVMRMPGEPKAEFLLLQPMVPTARPNMIAWVAARMDDPNYGATRVYRFPAESSVFGPTQIEARIDQDPIISQQITLWSQAGSTVIRGNLIVVPIGDSLLYLQPVYLQSTGSAFPEFRRIVVASPRKVVWGENLSDALRLLLAAEGSPTPSPTPGPSGGPNPSPTPIPSGGPGPSATPSSPDQLPDDVPGLIAYANQHFDTAQAALRAGDFATYGAEIARVQAALRKLDALAPGLGLPSPSAPASTAP